MAAKPDIFSQKNIDREFIIRVPPSIQQPRPKSGKSYAYLFIVPFFAASGITAFLQTQGVSLEVIFTHPIYIVEIVSGVILLDILAYIAATTLFE